MVLLFLVTSIGYFISAFAGGILVERFGMRGFLLLGAGTFLIGAFAFALAPPFALVLLARLAIGLGIGIIETGLNIYISALSHSATLLNYLHAFYGVGALIGPVIASTILVLNWNWNSMYFILGGLSLPMLLGFWYLFELKGSTTPASTEEIQKEKGNTLSETLKLGIVWLASFFLLFYVGVEVSLGNWTYTLLLEGRHENALLSGWVVSGYWFGADNGTLRTTKAGRTFWHQQYSTYLWLHGRHYTCYNAHLASSIRNCVRVWLLCDRFWSWSYLSYDGCTGT